MSKATDQRRPIEFFELVETTAIDNTRDYLAYIVAFATISWDDAVEIAGVIAWWLHCVNIPGNILATVEIGDDAATDRQGMFIIERVMIGDARYTTMHIGTTQVFCTNLFSRRGLNQWRTGQENSAIATHNHTFVTHSRNIGTSCGTGTHDDGDLRYALAGHTRLVVEDASKVLAVRKDFGLQGEKCSTGINQVDTGQVVLFGDLLGSQMLFNSHRIVSAAFDGCIISNNDAFLALDEPDPCYDASRWCLVIVHIPRCQWAEFQEGSIRITEQLDAFACQQLIAFAVFVYGLFSSTLLHQLYALTKLLEQLLKVTCILLKIGAITIYASFDDAHGCTFLS